MSYHNPDPIPSLADRLLACLERRSPNTPASVGALALALSALLREMDDEYAAPRILRNLADDLARLAADASTVVQHARATVQ